MVGKRKDETAGAAVEEFVGLKPKVYSFLIDDSSEHKKAKSVNKRVAATISHNEYRDVLLNDNCLRHSMNKIQKIIEQEPMKSIKLLDHALMT